MKFFKTENLNVNAMKYGIRICYKRKNHENNNHVKKIKITTSYKYLQLSSTSSKTYLKRYLCKCCMHLITKCYKNN